MAWRRRSRAINSYAIGQDRLEYSISAAEGIIYNTHFKYQARMWVLM